MYHARSTSAVRPLLALAQRLVYELERVLHARRPETGARGGGERADGRKLAGRPNLALGEIEDVLRERRVVRAGVGVGIGIVVIAGFIFIFLRIGRQ